MEYKSFCDIPVGTIFRVGIDDYIKKSDYEYRKFLSFDRSMIIIGDCKLMVEVVKYPNMEVI